MQGALGAVQLIYRFALLKPNMMGYSRLFSEIPFVSYVRCFLLLSFLFFFRGRGWVCKNKLDLKKRGKNMNGAPAFAPPFPLVRFLSHGAR